MSPSKRQKIESENFMRNETIHFQHKWHIDNFQVVDKELTSGPLFSSAFPPVDHHGLQWKIKLEKEEQARKKPDIFKLYMYYAGDQPIIACGSLFIEDLAGERVYSEVMHRDLYTATKREWGHPSFITRDKLLALKNIFSPKDTLTIGCDMTAFLNCKNEDAVVADRMAYVSRKERQTLKQDLERMLLKDEHSDVVIRVDGKHFPANRFLLSARSKVFEVMFNQAMEEGERKCIEIEDVEPDVMQELLTFIYTDVSPRLKEFSQQLLMVADKYDVGSLKVVAEEELANNLSAQNVIPILILSDTQCNAQLKEAALKFAVDNFRDIPKDQKWEDFRSRYPQLIDILMLKMSEK